MANAKITDVNEIMSWGIQSLNYDVVNKRLHYQFFDLCKEEDPSENETSSTRSHSPNSFIDLINPYIPYREPINLSNDYRRPHDLYAADFNINTKVAIWQGDITKLRADVIVNSTTYEILHGTGVNRAIMVAGGPELMAECRRMGGCSMGEVRVTGGHRLPAKYVFHTVGPSSETPRTLRSCYRKCLDLTQSMSPPVKTLAFPCISTGVKRYPGPAAARVALSTVSSWLRTHSESSIERIIFCTYLDEDVDIYTELISIYFPIALPKFNTFDLK